MLEMTSLKVFDAVSSQKLDRSAWECIPIFNAQDWHDSRWLDVSTTYY